MGTIIAAAGMVEEEEDGLLLLLLLLVEELKIVVAVPRATSALESRDDGPKPMEEFHKEPARIVTARTVPASFMRTTNMRCEDPSCSCCCTTIDGILSSCLCLCCCCCCCCCSVVVRSSALLCWMMMMASATRSFSAVMVTFPSCLGVRGRSSSSQHEIIF